ALWGKWMKWLLLIVSTIIFPLILGYTVRIYRGITPAPELEDWVDMFIDGLKLFIINLIYMIPVMIILGVALLPIIAVAASGNDAAIFAAIAAVLGGMALAFLVAIIISLIMFIGVIRFARQGSMGEAFNIRAILGHIGRIGWVDYIIALIILWLVLIVFSVVLGVIGNIPFIGLIITLALAPVIQIFEGRYMTRIYESVGAAV
ncbi:MAG: DUF4013 domain-containing protein, partial [Methanomicrobiaceae archaeon]|nr:DUF4013 domain-containing protein [Methanomicrobiaceae archaeon]